MSRTYSGSSTLQGGVRTVLKPQPAYMSRWMEDTNQVAISLFTAAKTQLKPVKPMA